MEIKKMDSDGLDVPHEGGYEESDTDAVDEDHPQQELERLQNPHVQHQAKAYRWYCRGEDQG